MSTPVFGPGIEITGRIPPEFAEILTPEAVAFAAKLQRAFGGRRAELLAHRARARPSSIAAHCRISCPRPRDPRRRLDVRADPADIVDRRVEITGRSTARW
jgi:malate synthase